MSTSWLTPYAPTPDSVNNFSGYSVAANYQIRIHSVLDGKPESSKLIVGSLPESFGLSLSSQWNDAFNKPMTDVFRGVFNSSLGNKIPGLGGTGPSVNSALSGTDIVSQMTGLSTQMKWLSLSTWQSGSPLSLNLPIVLKAFNNSVVDVTDVLVTLMSMVAPGTSPIGSLYAPGPTMVSEAAQALNAPILQGETITVELGNFLRLSPVIVKVVSTEIQSQFDINGNPITSTVNVSIETPYVVTKEDLIGFLKNSSMSRGNTAYKQTGGLGASAGASFSDAIVKGKQAAFDFAKGLF
jgi:hypothetical protein